MSCDNRLDGTVLSALSIGVVCYLILETPLAVGISRRHQIGTRTGAGVRVQLDQESQLDSYTLMLVLPTTHPQGIKERLHIGDIDNRLFPGFCAE